MAIEQRQVNGDGRGASHGANFTSTSQHRTKLRLLQDEADGLGAQRVIQRHGDRTVGVARLLSEHPLVAVLGEQSQQTVLPYKPSVHNCDRYVLHVCGVLRSDDNV
jgi:hypothetical protein